MPTHLQAKAAGTPTWVELTTPDIEAARDFYKQVIGWDYSISGPEYGNYTSASVGDLLAVGMAGNPAETPDKSAAWGVYFATNDIHADSAKAVELGAEQLLAPFAVGELGWMAAFKDPTGCEFSLWQAGTHVGSHISMDFGGAAWYELYTTDAKRARDFYAALFDLEASTMPGGMEYYLLKVDGEEVAGIMQIDPSWGASAPQQWATYFLVKDVDAAAKTVADNGGALLSGVDDSPFGRLIAVADPQGGMFKLIEPPAGG